MNNIWTKQRTKKEDFTGKRRRVTFLSYQKGWNFFKNSETHGKRLFFDWSSWKTERILTPSDYWEIHFSVCAIALDFAAEKTLLKSRINVTILTFQTIRRKLSSRISRLEGNELQYLKIQERRGIFFEILWVRDEKVLILRRVV